MKKTRIETALRYLFLLFLCSLMCIRSIYPRMLVRISGHSCRPLSLAMCKQSKKFPYFFHQSPLVTCWHWTSNSIKSLLITFFHCFQSKTFKTWWYFHLGFGGGEKIDNWSLKLNIVPGNRFVFTVQVFECLLMSSVMSCSMRCAREVLWKCKIKSNDAVPAQGGNRSLWNWVFGIYYEEEMGLEGRQDRWV